MIFLLNHYCHTTQNIDSYLLMIIFFQKKIKRIVKHLFTSVENYLRIGVVGKNGLANNLKSDKNFRIRFTIRDS